VVHYTASRMLYLRSKFQGTQVMREQSISLPMAILININIMMGSGIFLNTVLLAKGAGAVGFMSYLLVGSMLLPLVLTIAKLIEMHPSGGFYSYMSKEMNPFFGFITTWGYFTGKLASATIMIHTCVDTLQQLIPSLSIVHPFVIDFIILGTFIALNMLHIRTGSMIQAMFTTCKAIPILFAILAGLFLFSGANFTQPHLLWSGIPLILPITIYATMGFESACSISSKIHNAKRNAPLAILISYAINLTILMSYQFLFYGALGSSLSECATYRDMFPGLLGALIPEDPVLAAKIGGLFNIAIASSILGGSYGIIFSNVWNLYTLAQHKHVILPNLLTKFNRFSIPFICILVEGAICLLYLILSGGVQVTLQQLGALGVVFTYTMSALALINAKRKNPGISIPFWIPILGFINCLILITACINGLLKSGPTGLYGFIFLFGLGTLMYWYTARSTNAISE